MLGAYTFGPGAAHYTALPPEERIKRTLGYVANIHPQATKEFDCGAAVAWHRVPWTLGCAGAWTEDLRAQYYGRHVRHRRPHRPGGRALLAHPGLAGRRRALGAGRHPPSAHQSGGGLTMTLEHGKPVMTIRRVLAVFSLVLGVAAVSGAALAQGRRGGTDAYPEKTGEEIYKNVCQGCHMPDGKGAEGAGMYPALAGNKKLAAKAYPALVVVRGQKGHARVRFGLV